MNLPESFKMFNRAHIIDDEAMRAFLYQQYRLLFELAPRGQFSRRKQRTFEVAADGPDSWRVVCISRDALEHICRKGTAKGLRRAHPVDRKERAKYLFERSEPLSEQELLDYFFEHDTVALVPAKVNNKNGHNHWQELYKVEEGRFRAGESFSVRAKKDDKKWAKEMLQMIEGKANKSTPAQ